MRTTWLATLAALVLALPLGARPLLFHDHGHGLAFSPDGRALLAPSHHGLAVYEDGAWLEAAGPVQGFSGFSVAERAIYASGHTHPGVPVHEPVNLLRSTDGGRTWQPIAPALAGKADFRLLAAGYRSGALYVLALQPNPVMPLQGLYATHDEGRSWRRAAARGLEGEIHALAAHPREAGVVAIGTGRGLYLSRDGGETFRRLDRREPVTALAFDLEGKRLRYARALSNRVVESSLEGRGRRTLPLPALGLDYVTCLAQSPTEGGVLAFATRRRDVYLTEDGGLTWRLIAEGGEARGATATEGATDR